MAAEGELFEVGRHEFMPLDLVDGALLDGVPSTWPSLRYLGHPSILALS